MKEDNFTLVTLGCSWTQGVGVGYDETKMWDPEHGLDTGKIPYNFTQQQYDNIKGIDYPDYNNFIKNRNNKDFFKNFVWKELLDYSKYDYDKKIHEKIAWNNSINDEYSFRGILSKYLKFKNINFSMGGSSNEAQFNEMYKIFGNPKKRAQFLKGNPIVLWGITSTARIFRNNESIMFNDYVDNFSNSTDDKDLYTELYLKLYYDHQKCVSTLSDKIELWNIIFEHYNIPIIWFDTFNTHKYPNLPRNFVQGGDLLTQMVNVNKSKMSKIFTKVYHRSAWRVDDPRVKEGVKLKLLNPISCHPTKTGHELISEILLPYLEYYK